MCVIRDTDSSGSCGLILIKFKMAEATSELVEKEIGLGCDCDIDWDVIFEVKNIAEGPQKDSESEGSTAMTMSKYLQLKVSVFVY